MFIIFAHIKYCLMKRCLLLVLLIWSCSSVQIETLPLDPNLATEQPSAAPLSDSEPLLQNSTSQLNCVVQVVIPESLQDNLQIDNTCRTLLPPNQIAFEHSQALRFTEQGHELLVHEQCTASRLAFEQAFKLETGLHAQGYLSQRIVLARQCEKRLVRFMPVNTQTQQVAGLRVTQESLRLYQPAHLSATQTQVMRQAHQALSQGQCEQAEAGYKQLAELDLPEPVQQLLTQQQALVKLCLAPVLAVSPTPSVSPLPAEPSPAEIPSPYPTVTPTPFVPIPQPTTAFSATPAPVLPTPTGTPTPVTLPTATPVPQTLSNTLGMEFVFIEPGVFMMGQTPIAGHVHQVTLTQGFYLQTTEVTQKQWWDVMGSWPSTAPTVAHGLGDNYPMYYVSMEDIQNFLIRLNALGQGGYRLPTEAQWEYAARAGTTTVLSCEAQGGACPGDYAWYQSNNVPVGAKPVATKLPNPWGVFDMHGNVQEWVSDKYGGGGYPREDTVDPTGPAITDDRYVHRGGDSKSTSNTQISSAVRSYKGKAARDASLGFRLVRLF
jgi:formylglycine-generating enzyme required for sulfatase activity